MERKIVYIISLIVCCSAVWAGDFSSHGYGEFGAEFLKLPRNAQAGGLGMAVTAWEEDLAGFQVNPALLATAKNHQVNATYTHLTLDRMNNGLDYAGPVLGKHLMAVSVTHFGVRDIIETICVDDDCSDGDKTGETFPDNEFAFDLTYANTIPGWLSYGVRARYLYQNVGWDKYPDEGRAHGTGIDAGIYYSPWDKIGIGISVLNLGSKLWWATGRSDWVVPTFRAGVVGNLVDSVLQVGVDLVKPWAQPMEASTGIQVKVFKVLSLRTGMINALTLDQNNEASLMDPEFFLGFGLRYSYFGLDYAAMKPGSPFGLGHKFTLIVRFPGVFY